ncbi:ClpXP protease specificity-enhancing factor [Paraglaciecola polaris]|uniref:Stringent starvation protein B n=1 Tax=Paraglaciecola polaris LMG 21857 TaxID=1129793 RepID=K7A2K5_9ALTE|nr:ClpXP protease specificity-enhancing factor [Paraglaciecola polaris]GAC35153.1 stringent starvation protein B [Paraglaciecola polaris LMG 21857]
MTSNQPYLLRAFYEWIVDNNLTPYIVVDAHVSGALVPQEHVRDGQIVLNVSPASCGKLLLGNSEITFDARFGGVPRNIVVPCKAVLAIYAKENGAGTVFTAEDDFEGDGSDLTPSPVQSSGKSDSTSAPSKKGKPNLTIVK